MPTESAMVVSNCILNFEDANGHMAHPVVHQGYAADNPYDYLLDPLPLWPPLYRTQSIREVGDWPVNDPFEGRYWTQKRLLLRLVEKFHVTFVDKMLYNCRFGTQYDPVFATQGEGWTVLSELIPRGATWPILTFQIRFQDTGRNVKPVFTDESQFAIPNSLPFAVAITCFACRNVAI